MLKQLPDQRPLIAQNGPLLTESDTDWLFEKETITRPRVPALLGNKSRRLEESEINFVSVGHGQMKQPQS
jgi:hypothetical protein